MKHEHFHTIVIGAGLLGCATAISVKRQLGSRGRVLLIDKGTLLSGVSREHSGIVRAVNSHAASASMARSAIALWTRLDKVWGHGVPLSRCGSIWITPQNEGPKWSELETTLGSQGIDFFEVSHREVRRLGNNRLRLEAGERVYFEPNALAINPGDLARTVIDSIRSNGVDTREHCAVTGFLGDSEDNIHTVLTSKGSFHCEKVVNASGPWSQQLLSQFDIAVPVRLEQVLVGNWKVPGLHLAADEPLIADMTSGHYFRTWGDGQVHIHSRRRVESSFISNKFNVAAKHPDEIMKPGNDESAQLERDVRAYSRRIQARFGVEAKSINCSGASYRYFDITPDHRFILGSDNTIENLYHCVGAGQAMKYAPIFGQLLAKAICGESVSTPFHEDFSIARFKQSHSETQQWLPQLQAATA